MTICQNATKGVCRHTKTVKTAKQSKPSKVCCHACFSRAVVCCHWRWEEPTKPPTHTPPVVHTPCHYSEVGVQNMESPSFFNALPPPKAHALGPRRGTLVEGFWGCNPQTLCHPQYAQHLSFSFCMFYNKGAAARFDWRHWHSVHGFLHCCHIHGAPATSVPGSSASSLSLSLSLFLFGLSNIGLADVSDSSLLLFREPGVESEAKRWGASILK